MDTDSLSYITPLLDSVCWANLETYITAISGTNLFSQYSTHLGSHVFTIECSYHYTYIAAYNSTVYVSIKCPNTESYITTIISANLGAY